MEDTTKKPAPDSLPPLLNVWSMAGEVGLLIAVPIVVFVLMGIRLDKALQTTPLFIITGIILAMVISTAALARKIKRVTGSL